MDERPTKRRGPLLWLAGKRRWFWIVPIAAGLPAMYLLGWALMIRLMMQMGMSVEQIQTVIWFSWAFVAAGYSATFIWIVVQLFCRPRRWAKWTLVGVLALPVLYVASYGPGEILSALTIYTLPLQLAISDESPHWLRDGILWSVHLWNR
jgi:hypothetical protein